MAGSAFFVRAPSAHAQGVGAHAFGSCPGEKLRRRTAKVGVCMQIFVAEAVFPAIPGAEHHDVVFFNSVDMRFEIGGRQGGVGDCRFSEIQENDLSGKCLGRYFVESFPVGEEMVGHIDVCADMRVEANPFRVETVVDALVFPGHHRQGLPGPSRTIVIDRLGQIENALWLVHDSPFPALEKNNPHDGRILPGFVVYSNHSHIVEAVKNKTSRLVRLRKGIQSPLRETHQGIGRIREIDCRCRTENAQRRSSSPTTAREAA